MATFVGKMGVASSNIGNCTRSYIFAKGYHHLQRFLVIRVLVICNVFS